MQRLSFSGWWTSKELRSSVHDVTRYNHTGVGGLYVKGAKCLEQDEEDTGRCVENFPTNFELQGVLDDDSEDRDDALM